MKRPNDLELAFRFELSADVLEGEDVTVAIELGEIASATKRTSRYEIERMWAFSDNAPAATAALG